MIEYEIFGLRATIVILKTPHVCLASQVVGSSFEWLTNFKSKLVHSKSLLSHWQV